MKGIIKYTELVEQSLAEAITTIHSIQGIRFGDMTLANLLVAGSIAELKLSEHLNPACYGGGVYIFYEGQAPVYVGKANNFLHRFSSHRSTRPHPFWGWNALLLKVCAGRMSIMHEPTNEDLLAALSIVEEFEVVRILFDGTEDDRNLNRLERTIMKGMKYQNNTLLNTRVGKVNEHFMRQALRQLMQ